MGSKSGVTSYIYSNELYNVLHAFVTNKQYITDIILPTVRYCNDFITVIVALL